LRAPLGFVGFGEAGSRIAAGLRAAGTGEMFAYDIAVTDRMRQRAAEAGVMLAASNAELAARCGVMLSLVTAASALDAAHQNLPHLTASQVYVDGNSVSPALKQKIAAAIESAGVQFVEAAIMAPVPQRDGHRVPMLLNGAAADILAPYGFQFEKLAGPYGTAAAVKMCRSIVVKGLEALLTECVLAASHFGAEDLVFESLQRSFPGIAWKELADYMVNRVAVHGERRAHEMYEVAATLRAADIEPIMAEAAARRQQWAAVVGLAQHFGPQGPGTYRAVLDYLEFTSETSRA
jgi:3-hydroxyisobutyrate dehydrogenase-like beta-hydroxyacid dehydrogenase